MSYTVRPISDRTEFTGKHRQSQFATNWTETLELLFREVRMLNGRNLVIEADVTEGDLRIDGQIRANARPRTPAVRVAFESKHGPLVYATDRFWHWQDNVRAIALGLEALRKIERYGIAGREQQYTGFKALPAGTALPASHMTSGEARTVIANMVGDDPAIAVSMAHQPDIARSAYRKARAAAHPDRHDGDRSMWDQVEAAARVLGLAS